MREPLLDSLPLWAVFAVAFFGIILSEEFGYRIGLARRTRAPNEKEGPVGAMVGSVLALLGFLLAFVFGIAASRFDERRRLLIDEANAIGTTFLRAGLLPEPHRASVRQILAEYIDVRTPGAARGSIDEAIRRSEELQERLWTEAAAVAERTPQPVPSGLFIQSANELIDLHAKRVNAGLWSRLPMMVWLIIWSVAILAFGAMGYMTGLSGTVRTPAIWIVALTFALVMWVVVDLERPHEGLLRVNPRPLLELKKLIQPSEG